MQPPVNVHLFGIRQGRKFGKPNGASVSELDVLKYERAAALLTNDL